MYQRGAGWGAEPCLRCALGNIVKSGRWGYYWTTVEYWRVGPAPQQPAWPEAGQKRCPKPAAVAGRGRPVLAEAAPTTYAHNRVPTSPSAHQSIARHMTACVQKSRDDWRRGGAGGGAGCLRMEGMRAEGASSAARVRARRATSSRHLGLPYGSAEITQVLSAFERA